MREIDGIYMADRDGKFDREFLVHNLQFLEENMGYNGRQAIKLSEKDAAVWEMCEAELDWLLEHDKPIPQELARWAAKALRRKIKKPAATSQHGRQRLVWALAHSAWFFYPDLKVRTLVPIILEILKDRCPNINYDKVHNDLKVYQPPR